MYLLWLFYLLSKSALIDMTPSFTDTPRQQKIQYFQLKIFNNSSSNWKYPSNTVRPIRLSDMEYEASFPP